MSYLGAAAQLTTSEQAVVTALNQLSVTPSGQAIAKTGAATFSNVTASGGSGTGSVVGPSTSTNNALAIYSGTTGQIIKNSLITTNSTLNGLNVPGYTIFGPSVPVFTTPGAVLHEAWGTDNTINGIQIGVGNRSAGTSAYNGVFLNNNLADATVTHFAFLGLNSSTYTDTTFGTAFAVANLGFFQNTDGPLMIAATSASQGTIRFVVAGPDTTNEKMRLSSTGLTIGSTTITGLLNVGSAAQFQVDSSGNITNSGKFNKVTITAPATSATLTIADGGSLITSGANAVTLTSTGSQVYTFPASTDTLVGRASTDTLTNKTLTSPTIATSLILPTGTIRGQVTARKTADESVTSSTTLQNDDHLSFSIGANEEWVAVFYLDAGAALSTTGLKLAITTPASATQNITASMNPDVFTALDAGYKRTTTSGTALDFTTTLSAGVSAAGFTVSVWVLNSSTPGTVQLQFAQSTSSGTAVTLLKGSWMLASRVA